MKGALRCTGGAVSHKKKRVPWQYRSVHIAVVGFGILSEIEETARKYPSFVGIYKPRRRAPVGSGRTNLSFEKIIARLSSRELGTISRITRKDFYELLELMQSQLTKNVEMGQRGGNETVSPENRLAVTLRMLAGAGYGDIMLLCAIKQGTVYDIFQDTVDALKEELKLPLLPKTDEGLRRLADGMKRSRSRGNPLTDCIRALDGICIKIEKPEADLNPALFFCRKGYYAIPVQALVDHNYQFLRAAANCSESTHDALAHSSSKLGLNLMRRLFGKPYWIAGDEVYI